MNKNICIVCESGWIIVGIPTNETEEKKCLADASVVRSWSNGRGIGGIAEAEHKNEYTLDPIGDVIIRKDKILFEIPCGW